MEIEKKKHHERKSMISSFLKHEWVRPGFSSLFIALNDDALQQTEGQVVLTLSGHDLFSTPRVVSIVAQFGALLHQPSSTVPLALQLPQSEVQVLEGTILHSLSTSFSLQIPGDYRHHCRSSSRSQSESGSPFQKAAPTSLSSRGVVLRLDMIGVQVRDVDDEAVRHEVTVTMDEPPHSWNA